jgi:SAM-dependent methyltransferase
MDSLQSHGPDEIKHLKKQMDMNFPNEFKDVVQPRDHMLDVGCGSGDLILMLPENVYYTGVDLKNTINPIYLTNPKVKVIESDFIGWESAEKFNFINLRSVLWTTNEPEALLRKAFSHGSPEFKFFIMEPDDTGIGFSNGLNKLGKLAENWRKHVTAQGKNPLIGSKLSKMLKSMEIPNFKVKEKILRRTGDNKPYLTEAAENLVEIYSKYPDSDALKEECLKQIKEICSRDWLEEKYVYAFRA